MRFDLIAQLRWRMLLRHLLNNGVHHDVTKQAFLQHLFGRRSFGWHSLADFPQKRTLTGRGSGMRLDPFVDGLRGCVFGRESRRSDTLLVRSIISRLTSSWLLVHSLEAGSRVAEVAAGPPATCPPQRN